MSRPKDDVDRPRSVRIPMSERELQRLHKLAGEIAITTYLRRLLEREWSARKPVKR